MSSTRDELVTACTRGDELTIKRHGWHEIVEALTDWWWSREPFTARRSAAIRAGARQLPASRDHGRVARRGRKWRHRAGQVLAAVRAQQRHDDIRIDAGRASAPWRSGASLDAVRGTYTDTLKSGYASYISRADYSGGDMGFAGVVYHDAMRIGTTREQLALPARCANRAGASGAGANAVR